MVDKEERMALLYDALQWNFKFLSCDGKRNEARLVCEELYNTMAGAYNPVHPTVLKINNNTYSGERYARICYECLTRPVDTESQEVTESALSLAILTYKLIEQQNVAVASDIGSLSEAEMLVGKSIVIFERIYGRDEDIHCYMGLSSLSDTLSLKGDQDDEVLLERCLASNIKSDSSCVPSSTASLARFHRSKGKKLPLRNAERSL